MLCYQPPLELLACYIKIYFSPEAEEEDSVNNLCSTAHFALALKILVGQFNKRYDKKFQMRIGTMGFQYLELSKIELKTKTRI